MITEDCNRPVPDFLALLEAFPTPSALISRELSFLAVSDSFTAIARKSRDQIVGARVFEAFPTPPDEGGAKSQAAVRTSFERVLLTGKPDLMPAARYDLEAPGTGFEEHWWTLNHFPLLDGRGEVAWILQNVEDITASVLTKRDEVRSDGNAPAAEDHGSMVQEIRNARVRPLLLWAALGMVAVLACAIESFHSWTDFKQEARWVTHTHEVLECLASVSSGISKAEAEHRRFLLTGNQADLDRSRSASRNASKHVELVRALTADNTRQQKRIDQLERLLRQSFPADDASRTRQENPGPSLSAAIQEMEREEKLLLADRERRGEKAKFVGDVIIGAGYLLLLGIILGGAFALHRRTVALYREAAENAKSRRNYQMLARQVQNIREEDRARVARALHDELGETLTSARSQIDSAGESLHRGKLNDTAIKLVETESSLDELIRTTRRIAADLRPPLLDHLGLEAALEVHARELQSRTGLRVVVETPGASAPLRPDQTLALFRIAQESLTNVVRHARASAARVEVSRDDCDLLLRVIDNGAGFCRKGGSLGLLGMEERARMIGADLMIDSAPGAGTRVSARLPLSSS